MSLPPLTPELIDHIAQAISSSVPIPDMPFPHGLAWDGPDVSSVLDNQERNLRRSLAILTYKALLTFRPSGLPEHDPEFTHVLR